MDGLVKLVTVDRTKNEWRSKKVRGLHNAAKAFCSPQLNFSEKIGGSCSISAIICSIV